jgi:NAD(P)-dependent dehydrogenase (short-subunit alcohol dehydrogenase family)
MSSVTSDMTAVPANGVYAATKGAVNALTKAAAVEAASSNISVNSLAFAAIDIEDDMFWRFLNDQHIAPDQTCRRSRCVGSVGLRSSSPPRDTCSPTTRFVTGTALVLDGGYTEWRDALSGSVWAMVPASRAASSPTPNSSDDLRVGEVHTAEVSPALRCSGRH